MVALNVGCEVWTRIKRVANSGRKEGECWLRSYQPIAVECDHCDSGVMSCKVYDNTDYTSTDNRIGYSIPNGIISSNQECYGLCYGTLSKSLHLNEHSTYPN